MFFTKSEKTLRIDYVMVYNLGEVNAQKEKLRKQFEDNLADVGVVYEHEVLRTKRRLLRTYKGRIKTVKYGKSGRD